MIAGIGVDTVELERIKQVLTRQGVKFVEKILTEREQERLQKRNGPYSHHDISYIAGRFAAKEAVVKALGTGFRDIGFHDIEILSDHLGKPVVVLSENIASNSELHISISHAKTVATSFCIWEKNPCKN